MEEGDKCPKCGGSMDKEYATTPDGGPNPDYAITYPTCSNCGFQLQRISLKEEKKGITLGDWMKTMRNQIDE